jgi:hypothetical protein
MINKNIRIIEIISETVLIYGEDEFVNKENDKIEKDTALSQFFCEE